MEIPYQTIDQEALIGSFETHFRGGLGEIAPFRAWIYRSEYTQGSHLDMEISGEGITISGILEYEKILSHYVVFHCNSKLLL